MICNTDKLMFERLMGSGPVVYKQALYVVVRNGRVLLAIPSDRVAANMTLKLYQPQKFLAKAYTLALKFLVYFGLHKLLPRVQLQLAKNGPVSSSSNYLDSIGLLFGNPEADNQKIIVVRKEVDVWVVDKIGFEKLSKKAIVNETNTISSLPKGGTGIPVLLGKEQQENWAMYTTRFTDGDSPRPCDDDRVLDVLTSWSKYGESMAFSDTEQWNSMLVYAKENGGLDVWNEINTAAPINIMVGLYHGDFTPWNIKTLSNGSISVFDWEHGINKGPAAWDWLHYLIQRATLVDHLSPSETLEICREWAKSEKGGRFLDEAGWGNQIEPWIGTYLAYSSWIAGFDRDELLSSWMVNQRLDS